MYVCIECGKIFTEPDYWEERHGLDTGPYEHFSGCPICNGNYMDAYRCDECDEWITDEYIKIGEKRYCQDCYLIYNLGEE